MGFNFLKTTVVTMGVAAIALFSSCENEDMQISKDSQDNQILESEISLPDSLSKQWIIPMHKNGLSKGYKGDFRWKGDFSERYSGDDSVLNSIRYVTYKNKVYELMKVYRRNSDKYFYVMTTNLDYPVSKGCWAYDDNEKNVKFYGRLYTWQAAKELASKITLDLPIYKKNGDVYSSHYQTQGRLLTSEDVCDIIERESIGNNTDNGFYLDDIDPTTDCFYYDIFIGGFDYITPEQPCRVLAGGRASHSGVKRYDFLGDFGEFWLENTVEGAAAREHFTLCIQKYYRRSANDVKYYNHVAYINRMLTNENGVSVRLVFEPVYRKR